MRRSGLAVLAALLSAVVGWTSPAMANTGGQAAAERSGCWAADEARLSGRLATSLTPVTQIPIPEGAVVARVTRTINRPIATVFDYIIDVDLTRIAGPRDGRPGIVSTTIPRGWNRAGQVRVNTSSDGATIREQLVRVDRPAYFSYCIDQYSSAAVRGLIDRTEGAWLLKDNGDETTSIEWVYSIVPTNPTARDQLRGALGSSRAALESFLGTIKEEMER